jgi:hypothetical protein
MLGIILAMLADGNAITYFVTSYITFTLDDNNELQST